MESTRIVNHLGRIPVAVAAALLLACFGLAGCKQGAGQRCQLRSDCANACEAGETVGSGCFVCANPVTGSEDCGQGVGGDCMCVDEITVMGTDGGPGTDTGTDMGTDSGTDMGTDMGTDASDATMDMSVDMGTDAMTTDMGMTDAAMDCGVDAGDAAMDGGC